MRDMIMILISSMILFLSCDETVIYPDISESEIFLSNVASVDQILDYDVVWENDGWVIKGFTTKKEFTYFGEEVTKPKYRRCLSISLLKVGKLEEYFFKTGEFYQDGEIVDQIKPLESYSAECEFSGYLPVNEDEYQILITNYWSKDITPQQIAETQHSRLTIKNGELYIGSWN